MKIKSILFCFLLSINLYSDDFKFTNYQFGYTDSSTKTNIDKENKSDGIYNSVDLMSYNKSNDFSFGIGMDINVWNSPSYNITKGYPVYTMGITAKTGYSIYNQTGIPLKVKTGIGYGLMDIDVHDSFGLQYEYGMEIDLYKSLGIGIKYKYAESNIFDKNIENKNIIYYLYF